MIRFKNWWRWFKRQPWSYKWFLWLVLLRPIIDVFWFVKESALFSPLQVAGLLTFLFAFLYAIKLPSRKKGQIPLTFSLFAGLLVINLFLVATEIWTAGSFIRFVRFSTPILLFIYLAKAMRNETRFLGLLFTFLVSSIFPLSMLYYESIFDPISQVALSESRGGGFRLTGLYADLFNYMSYVIGDFLILSYFFIRSLKGSYRKVGVVKISIVIALTLVGISGLKHQASWGVFLFILMSVVISGFKNRKVKQYVLMIGFPILFLAPVVILPTVEKLFAKEIGAYTGERDSKRILNGRLVRWEYYFDAWAEIPISSKLLGVSFSDLTKRQKQGMTGGGMHSDYVRFLFASGIIGLISFLLFYLRISIGRRNFRKPEQFFITTCIGIMCLYSVSSNPFGASGSLMFILFGGMALSLNSSKKFYPETASDRSIVAENDTTEPEKGNG